MEQRDWLVLIVQIVVQLIVVFIFGLFIERKIKQKDNKHLSKTEVINLLLGDLHNLNVGMIQTNMKAMMYPNMNEELWDIIKENILFNWVKVIARFDSFKDDLEEFYAPFNEMDECWKRFIEEKDDRDELGRKLQEFKNKNLNLIKIIRNNY